MKKKQDWAVRIAERLPRKVGIYPNDRYYERDNKKFVTLIAKALRRAKKLGYAKGFSEGTLNAELRPRGIRP